jgi:hypothetical protein
MAQTPQLEKLNTQRLGQLEYGQFIKTQADSISKLPSGTITDAGLQASINKLLDKSQSYDDSLVKIKKSEHTDRLTALDQKRDASVAAFGAAIRLALKSDDPAEVAAGEHLDTVFSTYGGHDIAAYNYEKESNTIENLVDDLEKKFNDLVNLAGIGRYVTRLKNDNIAFNTVFSDRINESATQTLLDAKEECKALSEAYDDFTGYLLYKCQSTGYPAVYPIAKRR